MLTVAIALLSGIGFLLAYRIYGNWLSQSVFQIDSERLVPSKECEDGVDYVPTRRSIIFGHHFTSIAGTGPIVGPAIAVFWGWLPALLWVFFGSIFVGAVHDFGALVVSLRNRGQTVGEIAGRLISPRARVLFLLVLFFALTVVLAVFGLVIAIIFKLYPESVFSVWLAMPLAVLVGWISRRGGPLLLSTVVSVGLLYAAVYAGVQSSALQLAIPDSVGNTVIIWTVILMIYCFVASVLPVWTLLQPRDYLNSFQLYIALALVVAGVCVAGFTGQADLVASAPMVASQTIEGAPPMWPFLFVTIACGACSGFHCLVSSGTTSKQIACESDAQAVGYGGMLLEGMLAVLVILCCTAGLGIGISGGEGEILTGQAAWASRYTASGNWANFGLPQMLGAFVDGGANFLTTLGFSAAMGKGILAVLVACFAATTLDSATRLQRYVIQELGESLYLPPLKNKYVATSVAVGLGLVVACLPGPKGAGSGGLILWPLFGATNQLLAGLALMVTSVYLWRRHRPLAFILIPTLFMLAMPFLAMLSKMKDWYGEGKHLLLGVGITVIGLQVWMIVEGALIFLKAEQALEPPLPPLAPKSTEDNLTTASN